MEATTRSETASMRFGSPRLVGKLELKWTVF